MCCDGVATTDILQYERDTLCSLHLPGFNFVPLLRVLPDREVRTFLPIMLSSSLANRISRTLQTKLRIQRTLSHPVRGFTPGRSNRLYSKMPKSPDTTLSEFREVVNMDKGELEDWLKTDVSQSVGWGKGENGESVGHESGRRIVSMLGKSDDELLEDEDDVAHMRRVVSYVRRHVAQRHKLQHDVEDSKWRHSLMNWCGFFIHNYFRTASKSYRIIRLNLFKWPGKRGLGWLSARAMGDFFNRTRTNLVLN